MYSSRKKQKMQGKNPTHRDVIIRSQILEIIRAERIKTTPTKGRILKQNFDKLITEAKKNSPASRQNVEQFLRNEKAVQRLFNVILPRLAKTTSGYLVSARTLPRKGDNAPQMICMLKDHQIKEQKSKLTATLEKQEAKSGKRGGGRLLGLGGGKKSAQGDGKKIESMADTRRVST